jgi:hypothetical protein
MYSDKCNKTRLLRAHCMLTRPSQLSAQVRYLSTYATKCIAACIKLYVMKSIIDTQTMSLVLKNEKTNVRCTPCMIMLIWGKRHMVYDSYWIANIEQPSLTWSAVNLFLFCRFVTSWSRSMVQECVFVVSQMTKGNTWQRCCRRMVE